MKEGEESFNATITMLLTTEDNDGGGRKPAKKMEIEAYSSLEQVGKLQEPESGP